MSLRYSDKVCIVTGGSSGIGSGIVRVFVTHGAQVVFCAPGIDDGKQLADDITSSGPGRATYVQCDVTKEEDIKRMIDFTVTQYGRLDCLINNAGWHPPHKYIDDFSAQEFRDLFDLNVMGYFLTCKYALPHIRNTRGCIINNSSLVSRIGQSGAVTYCATKGAVSAMTRALAIDEAQNDVRVVAFSPGNINTEHWPGDATGEAREKLVLTGHEAQLIGRMGTVEEVGLLCLYLAAEATFLTGVDIPISAGAELSYGRKTRKVSTADVFAV